MYRYLVSYCRANNSDFKKQIEFNKILWFFEHLYSFIYLYTDYDSLQFGWARQSCVSNILIHVSHYYIEVLVSLFYWLLLTAPTVKIWFVQYMYKIITLSPSCCWKITTYHIISSSHSDSRMQMYCYWLRFLFSSPYLMLKHDH